MKTHMTIFQKSETPQAKEKRQDLFCPVVFLHHWCGREGLNLHALRHWILNPARLPVPPRPHFYIQQQNAVKIKVFNCYTKVSSTKSSVSASSTTGAFYKNQVVKPEVITYLIFPPRYRHLNPSRLPIPPRAHIT